MCFLPRLIAIALSVVITAALFAAPANAQYFNQGSWTWPISRFWSLARPLFGLRWLAHPSAPYGVSGYYYYRNNGRDLYPADVQYYQPYSYRAFGPPPWQTDPNGNEPAESIRRSRMDSQRDADLAILDGADRALRPDEPVASAPALVRRPFAPPAPVPAVAAPPGEPAASPLQVSLTKMFIDRVNKRFRGNIRKALDDADTRSLAQAIGLIDPADPYGLDLSDPRVSVARHIMGDSSLSLTNKLDAIRAILRR